MKGEADEYWSKVEQKHDREMRKAKRKLRNAKFDEECAKNGVNILGGKGAGLSVQTGRRPIKVMRGGGSQSPDSPGKLR